VRIVPLSMQVRKKDPSGLAREVLQGGQCRNERFQFLRPRRASREPLQVPEAAAAAVRSDRQNGSGCCQSPRRAELTLSAINQSLEHSDQGRTKDGYLR